MEWLLCLLFVVPACIWGLYRPQNPRWQLARRAFWVSLPVMASWFMFIVYVIGPNVQAPVYYGAWGIFVAIATVYCLAAGTVQHELRKSRQLNSVKVETPSDPPER